jgi:hypothetical protein
MPLGLGMPLDAFIDGLSPEELAKLAEQLAQLAVLYFARVLREACVAAGRAPPAQTDEQDVTAKQAGTLLGCSDYEVRAMCQRGELDGYQRVPGGVWHIPPAAVRRYRARQLARGADLRYTPGHDIPRGQSAAPAARLDAAPAGRRVERDGDDRRALGTRRAHRQSAGRDEPYAPGQAAWSGSPLPRPKG